MNNFRGNYRTQLFSAEQLLLMYNRFYLSFVTKKSCLLLLEIRLMQAVRMKMQQAVKTKTNELKLA